MKLLALAFAVPVLLTGCAAYVGDAGPDYPGYYDGYGAPGYYVGGPTYVGVYGYDRGHYHHDYRHAGGGYHHAAFASHSPHVGGTRVASHSGGHFGGSSVSHASASVGGGHSGGGHGGGHR